MSDLLAEAVCTLLLSSTGKACQCTKHLDLHWFCQELLLPHSLTRLFEEVCIVMCLKGSFVLVAGDLFSTILLRGKERSLGRTRTSRS